MSAFEMIGVVSADFDTGYNVIHYSVKGSFVDGVWTKIHSAPQSLTACVQPLSENEINFLQNGGERVVDARKLYITEPIINLSLDSYFEFLGQRWKVYRIDGRPENNYFKIIVSRVDK